NLIYAGISFGVAEIIKFSAILLIPYFAVLMIVFYVASVASDWHTTEAKLRRFFIRCLRYVKSLLVIFAIGYITIVYPIYFLFTIHYPSEKQITDTEFILHSFAGGPTGAGITCHGLRC